MIEGFEPRLYQQSIFANASGQNTLVVLPTGMGKTGIALMMAAHRLNLYPESKILFLAPTKPLTEQHYITFQKHLPQFPATVLSGSIKPEKRAQLWEESQLIVSTPQGIQNDVISNRIKLDKVSLIIFDEAHRATGDYSYVFLAHKYVKDALKEKILALTASPGNEKQVIQEVVDNLHIESVEVRSEEDEDVKPYVQDTTIQWIEVELPKNFDKLLKNLRAIVKNKLKEIAQYGYYQETKYNPSKKTLLRLQAELQGRMQSGEKDYEVIKSISLAAEAMKAEHALELAETQGIAALMSYLKELYAQAGRSQSKAVQNLVRDSYFKAAYIIAEELNEQGTEHPKLKKLMQLVQENKNQKIIIFNQFRDQAIRIKQELDEMGVSCELFFGQAKKKGKGLSQKEQKAMIQEFAKGEFQCLIATSVAEEGLDIPQVDKVIFYEPIPSAIRTVQRRGRTGRQAAGTVQVLLAKNTRDESYKWSAHHREKRMFRVIKEFRTKTRDKKLTTFQEKMQEEIMIVIDHRERHSGIVKEFSKSGVNIQLHKLDIGDYLLSENVIVEYKTQEDFVNSIIDGRLLNQAPNLKKYSKPVIIIEGDNDLFSQRNVHPNAIRGMLTTLTLNFRIPVLYTKNVKDTAQLMMLIAKQEQTSPPKTAELHSTKPKTEKEMKEFIVSSLPGIGSTLARPLLEHFGSVKKVLMATNDELEKVPLIGKRKAESIRNILDSDY